MQGRSADLLTFPGAHGEDVHLMPPMFLVLLERVAGIDQVQIIQPTPATLRVRLRTAPGADADRVWKALRAEIAHLLTDHELADVTLERADEAPQPSPGGKYRTIIPLTKP